MAIAVMDYLKHGAVTDQFFRRPPFFYNQILNFFRKMEDCDLDERKKLQRQRVTDILRAARRSSFYQALQLADDLGGWPALTKELLRSQPEGFTATTMTASPAATGGTTGTPLKLRRSWHAVIAEQVAIDQFLMRAGINIAKARIAVLRGDTIKDSSDHNPPFWVTKAGGRKLLLSSNHLSVNTIGNYLEALRKFNPEVLTVYPSALEALCGLIGPAGVRIPGLKLVFSSSEVLRADIRERVITTLGTPVLDMYGQAERVSLATSVQPGAFFFQPAYGLTELRFARSDERHDYYEVQGTSLWNTAQFLIRYQTDDLAILPKGTSAADVEKISFGLRPFLGIAGRSSEYIETPTGERIVGINHIPRGLSGVVQMQLVQRARDRVDIYVVPETKLSPTLEKLIIQQARKKIPPSVELKLHQVERIERTKSGKAPLLIRDIR